MTAWFRTSNFTSTALLMVGAVPPEYAVTLGAFTGAVQAGNADPWIGVNHTLAADDDYALVIVSWETSHTIAVTFGGVAMTAGAQAGPVATGQTSAQLFWLAAASLPAPGTVSVVVNPSGANAGYVAIWTLKGAVQGAPNRTDVKAASATSVAPSLAAVQAGAVVMSGANINDSAQPVTFTGGTQKYSNNGATGGHWGVYGDKFALSPINITHTYSGAFSQRRAAVMVEVLPSGSPVAGYVITDFVSAGYVL